jgi:polyisoprenoid-binding protein YceI
MKAKIITIFFAFILIQTVQSQQLFITGTGTASFTSDAPLELIKAKSDQLQGIINLSDRSFTFSINNRSFIGFNSKLQREHFYENYMEVEDYPVSTFKGKIIEEIDINSREPQVVRAKGIINIHGVEQERIIKGTIRLTGDAIELNADFTILLADHKIKIPRVVYQKIAEVIDVIVTAELTKKIN